MAGEDDVDGSRALCHRWRRTPRPDADESSRTWHVRRVRQSHVRGQTPSHGRERLRLFALGCFVRGDSMDLRDVLAVSALELLRVAAGAGADLVLHLRQLRIDL